MAGEQGVPIDQFVDRWDDDCINHLFLWTVMKMLSEAQ